MKKKLSKILAAILCVCTLTACGSGGQEAAPEEESAAKDTLTIATQADMGDKDPINGITTNDTIKIKAQVYETLIERTVPNQEYKPLLAEKWEFNDDGTELTITLRDGVKFHNGEALTAEDCLFSLQCLRESANKSVTDHMDLENSYAVDDRTFVIVMDEPTSSLDEEETQRLFAVVRKLKAQGLGVIFVSHFLDQIYELCDRITVLRNGELVGAYAVAELPRVELISKMIGKELGDIQSMGKNTALCGDGVLIEADGLSAFGRIQDFDLQIHRGEVVGFAGLLGSGRTETAELLAGVAKPEQGALRMNGREVHFNSPLDAMHHKIAFCPEDRKIQGIIGDLSVRENIIIGLQAKKGMWNHIPLKEQERIADEYIKLLQIKVSSPEQLIRNLSGGNQQKAIIARWLVTQPDLLILDEPTRGIDIGTKTEIQKMVIQLAREQHMSIIFISSEIDEMTRTCTRLAVLRDRRKVAELTGDDINSDRVMAAIAGGA